MPKPAKQMNDRLRSFCEGILSGKDKKEAYTDAGYKSTWPATSASMALANPVVQEYLEERRAEIRERTNVDAEKVIAEIATIAFADIRDVATWTESGVLFVPSGELEDHEAKAIASVKSRRRVHRDKEGGETEVTELEVKLHPKLDALEKLSKHLGLYQKDAVNVKDRQTDLLATVLWRYIMALHLEQGMTFAEAKLRAEKNPEEVEAWGREVKLLKEP